MSRDKLVKELKEKSEFFSFTDNDQVKILCSLCKEAAEVIETQLQDDIDNEEYYQCRGC